MQITGLQELDSLAREALRQYLFFRPKNPRLATMWEQIHKEAMLAMNQERPLLVGSVEQNTPIPIKHGAQHEQLGK